MSYHTRRALFFPTLGYNVVMERLAFRDWYNRIDDNVVLGALPFRSQTQQVQPPLAAIIPILI